jgi:ribosomal protein L11 methyltransferase
MGEHKKAAHFAFEKVNMSDTGAEKSAWLEISLIVDGELAEAVAEVLSRYAPNGVAIESTAVQSSPDDTEGSPVGPLRVSAYLPVDEDLEEKRRRIDEGLWYLGRIQPLPEARFRTIEETDWSEAWKQHYHPILIGTRLVIVPAWLEPPTGDRIVIRMDPGMAFGTGTHPSTQLCLEMIEDVLSGPDARQGIEVIDVGCGSGILSVAALKLGAAKALGVDIDRISVRVSRENAALNEIASGFEVGLGSVSEVLRGDFSIRQGHLVLANILAPVIIQLFEDGLADLVTPGGSLILAGIIEEQAADVLAAARARGLELADRRQINDWVALRVTK